MSEYPIDFCVHLALAVKKRQKTVTYKPLSRTELALQTAGKPVPSPYGQVGDVLWVREPAGDLNGHVAYQCDYMLGDGYRTRVSLPDDFMSGPPITRDQARLLLTVQAVDIVNLQTVDEVAAKAAGTIPVLGRTTFLDEFKAQWNEAYRLQPWDTNPSVWRVTFVVQ